MIKQFDHYHGHKGPEVLQLCMLLGLLVHKEVTSLELPQCDLNVRSNTLAFERLWRKVAECASGSLLRLSSSVTMNAKTPFVQFLFNNVHTFTNLRELDVHYFFVDDRIFELVSKRLPQLRLINSSLFDLYISIEKQPSDWNFYSRSLKFVYKIIL
jgi:hypothetical protein